MVLPILFSALAPSVLAGTGMSALTASALGAGLGGAIQTGDLEKGLLTGLGAFAGGSLLGPILGGGAGTEAGTAAAGATPAAAAAPAAPTMTGAPAAPPPAMPPTPVPGAVPAAAAAAPGGIRGLVGNAMDFAKSPTGMGVGIGAALGPAIPGLFGGGEDDGKGGGRRGGGMRSREAKPIPRIPTMPGADYEPGVSGEFNYGISTPYSAGQITDYTMRGVRPYADGGMLQRMANPVLPGIGPVRLARGGIVALADGGPAPSAPNERELISAAVMAIRGEHPQPEVALGAFLATFGEQALRQLVDSVQSGEMEDTAGRFAKGEKGEVRGPGDGSGTDDMVPAKMEDGSGDVLLSDGEFVMRKDAVDSVEKKFGGGFLDEVNQAGSKAGDVAARRMVPA